MYISACGRPRYDVKLDIVDQSYAERGKNASLMFFIIYKPTEMLLNSNDKGLLIVIRKVCTKWK